MTQSPDMSNDTARQIEEIARDVDPFGWGDACPESLREHYQNSAKVIADRLLAAGYTKPAPAARPSAEIAEALAAFNNVPDAALSLNSSYVRLFTAGRTLAAALRAEQAKSREMGEALEPLKSQADKAYRACMSAWSCGEPEHRVKTMLDEVEQLGVVLGVPGAVSPFARAARVTEQPE